VGELKRAIAHEEQERRKQDRFASIHDDEPLRFCLSDQYHPNWHQITVT
jgi:hypothetical protein